MTIFRVPAVNAPLSVTARVSARVAHIRLDGELEDRTAPLLVEAAGWLRPGVADTVVVDCRRLGFVDARGLTALLRAREAVAAVGADLVLAHPSAMLSRMLIATALTERLPVAGPDLLAGLDDPPETVRHRAG